VSERPAAGFITAGLVVPLVLLCCLGPVAVASFFAGFVAWLGGLSVATIVGAAIAIGSLAYGFLRGRNWLLCRRAKV
jgi:hypothetical protein